MLALDLVLHSLVAYRDRERHIVHGLTIQANAATDLDTRAALHAAVQEHLKHTHEADRAAQALQYLRSVGFPAIPQTYVGPAVGAHIREAIADQLDGLAALDTRADTIRTELLTD